MSKRLCITASHMKLVNIVITAVEVMTGRRVMMEKFDFNTMTGCLQIRQGYTSCHVLSHKLAIARSEVRFIYGDGNDAVRLTATYEVDQRVTICNDTEWFKATPAVEGPVELMLWTGYSLAHRRMTPADKEGAIARAKARGMNLIDYLPQIQLPAGV